MWLCLQGFLEQLYETCGRDSKEEQNEVVWWLQSGQSLVIHSCPGSYLKSFRYLEFCLGLIQCSDSHLFSECRCFKITWFERLSFHVVSEFSKGHSCYICSSVAFATSSLALSIMSTAALLIILVLFVFKV